MKEFQKGKLYRMPAHFGPTAGPRQGPKGETFDWSRTPYRTIASVSFLTDAARLEEILPPGFALEGEPVATLEWQYMTQLEWLAGRGYNTIGIKIPARYRGKRDEVVGSFLAVLWENLADPILSGRDELGFSKVYCEIPEPRILRGHHHYQASWLGHAFLDLELHELKETSPGSAPPVPGPSPNEGILHFKYVPRTGARGEADVAYATLTPAAGSLQKIDRVWLGKGGFRFRPSSWEELPTMFHIVNALAELPVHAYRDVRLIEAHGGKDLGDQRALA